MRGQAMGSEMIERGVRAALLAVMGLGPGCYSGVGDAEPEALDGGEEGESDTSEDELPPIADQCADGELEPGPSVLRRLTVPEYAASVHALTGVDVAEDARGLLPPDPRADGFSNTASGLITTLDHVEGYDRLAELVVASMDLTAFTAQHAPCTEFGDECEQGVLRSMGRSIYRAPLLDDELALLQPVFSVVQGEGEGFEVAVGLVLGTMLQSPRFLFRMEAERGDGSVRELDGYEMASRLSYLVWGAPPDEALLDAAEAGDLRADEMLEAQVRRMLDDERVRASTTRFIDDWLHLQRLDELTRDPARFPDWRFALGEQMQAETRAFARQVLLDEGRPYGELFNAQFTIVEPDLAAHYGLPEPGPDGRVDLDEVPERGGLLTQGALLTLGGNESSTVARGQFVLETILCGRLESPPPGVDTTPPEAEEGKSQRFYSEQRVDNPSCSGCHVQMEPYAWGIERYVADGTYHLADEFGNELREDGYVRLPGSDGNAPYTSAAEMMDLLAESEAVEACFERRSLQFALGRAVEMTDHCTVQAIRDRVSESSGTYEDLLVAIALSPGFRTIATEPAP